MCHSFLNQTVIDVFWGLQAYRGVHLHLFSSHILTKHSLTPPPESRDLYYQAWQLSLMLVSKDTWKGWQNGSRSWFTLFIYLEEVQIIKDTFKPYFFNSRVRPLYSSPLFILAHFFYSLSTLLKQAMNSVTSLWSLQFAGKILCKNLCFTWSFLLYILVRYDCI